MIYRLSEEDQTFRAQFETCELALDQFDHRGHLRLAYIYLTDNDTETAYGMMRDALRAFIKFNNVDPSKYHETITRAWILAVRHFMQKTTHAESADNFIDQNTAMLDPKIMMTHYSAPLLFSDEARAAFVEPDLDAIPRYDEADKV